MLLLLIKDESALGFSKDDTCDEDEGRNPLQYCLAEKERNAIINIGMAEFIIEKGYLVVRKI